MTEPIPGVPPRASDADAVALFVSGDVMIGRGVDQIMPQRCEPDLFEPVVRSALDYVTLAERAHGPIPRPMDYTYVWGVALEALDARHPDLRIVNLETSITTSDDAMPKGINYRMHPGNVRALSAARIDCTVLANNHVLDWGPAGLYETLDSLTSARIHLAGAGRTIDAAEAPATLALPNDGRALVFAFGGGDSGIPSSWGARAEVPGVSRLADYSMATVEQIARRVARVKRSGDIAIASIHWGSNWGYDIPAQHRRFAHALIERAAIDLVHGHSSHHPKAIEVHRGRVIFYGCGDLLNDYEGISGRDEFRGDLTLMYFPIVDARTGELARLEMVPLLIRHLSLERPSATDAKWLRGVLDRECRRFGHRVGERDGAFVLDRS